MRVLVAVLLLIVTSFSAAHADPQDPTVDRPMADPVQESEARAFMRGIRCVVCQSQSIDESDAEIAAQLRNVIRELMAAGKSEDEIRDYLVARYGDFVLLDPPFKPQTLILWIGPFVLAGIALVGGFSVLRRQRQAGAAPPELSESERRRVQSLLIDGENDSSNGRSPGGAS